MNESFEREPAIDLTPELLSRSRVIARGQRIRDVLRLVSKYGGKPADWKKKSSPAIEIENRVVELHWYECDTFGRFEIKQVPVDQ